MEQLNSDVYFHNSLEFLRLSNYESAMESIELAITSGNYKSFYMLQKIKILYVSQKYTLCYDYITENLKNLYANSPLHIFSQILHYYQTSSGYSVAALEDFLLINNIPSILAYEYTTFIDHPDMDLLGQAISSIESEEYVKCIDYCNLLLHKDPSDLTAYLTKAKCHCLLGEHDLGISTYEKAITLEANPSSIYHELGTVMFSIERYPKAILYFEKALELDPSNTHLVFKLAESFYLWKKYDSALVYLKKSLYLNPNCNETLLRIAATYEQMNKPKKAKKYYKKILDTTKCL